MATVEYLRLLQLEMKIIKFKYLCWSGHDFPPRLRIIYLSSIRAGRALGSTQPNSG